MVSPYVPPQYKDFGKATRDLLSRKFTYESSVKAINKSPSGLTIETQGTYTGSAWRGNVKAVQKQAFNKQGDLELTTATDASLPTTATFTFNKVNGATAKLEATTKSKDKAFTGAVISTNVDYSTNHLAASINVAADLNKKSKVELGLAAGAEGLSVGGAAVIDVTNGADLVDINGGIEYTPDKRQTYSVFTSNNFDFLNLSTNARLPQGQLVGLLTKVKLDDPTKPVIQAGVEHVLNSSTTLKTKVEFPTSLVDSAIEYRLANPKLLVGLAARFNGNGLIKGTKFGGAEKFGINLTWGDY